MKASIFAAAFLFSVGLAQAADTDPPSPDIAAFIGQIIMPAGDPNGSTTIATVPAGKRLVIQTVSIFRSGVVAGSILNTFLQIREGGQTGYFALPNAVADGSVYPSSTLSATIYAGTGTPVIVNVYRNGSDSAPEVDNVVIHGYYVSAT